ncbi:MAG: prolyl oligopeptidase family serine peptidase [Bacteroidales bacterium]
MACTKKQPFDYPETRKGDVVEDYHGTQVADPYRWLEDDMSEETAAWVKSQNELTFSYLEKIPFRNELKDRMTQIWNFSKMGLPVKKGDLYFYSFNSGLQNQDVVYVRTGLEGEGRVFLDPNTLSADGTVALAGASVSNDNRYYAYAVSRGGSDWREVYVRDIASGQDLEDHLMWIKFSGIAWLGDGFFYTRYDQPAEGDELKAENKNSKIYFHRVGTPQDADQLIYLDEAHPDWGFSLEVTDDEKYTILYVTESTSGNALGVRKSSEKDGKFTWLELGFDSNYQVIGSKDDILYVLTDFEAPRYRLVAVDMARPEKENWVDVIPQHDRNVLESATLGGGRILATFLQDAYSVAEVFDLSGTLLHQVELPGIGSLEGISARMEEKTAFFSYSSFDVPGTVYKYDIETNEAVVFYAPDVDFDSEAYETKQVFYNSKDGTRVPMFIVHKKGMELNGTAPTLLYGYGGFNITYSPSFSTARAVWLEQGGVFALANIRGGGEYGEEWHKAGTVLQKQNVFDDFIAAAEYLIDEKYTSPDRLAVYGGSNGGLLIGAVINQRPDLFAAAIPMVGVMDMLRFHKFTIGRYWTVDYGSSDDPEQFRYLMTYSPLHNIEDRDYPAVLVTTGDHDDRVVPAHSFKYIATLQAAYTGPNPVMIRINTDAGHGAGKPTTKVIEEYSDVWSFLFENMDFTPAFHSGE